MKNYLLVFMVLCSSIEDAFSTVLELEATRINFDITVMPPTCNLSYSNKVDFGKIEISMLEKSPPLQPIHLKFTDCSANLVEIGFAGKYIDYNNNYISNSIGEAFSKGIVIKLLDESGRNFPLTSPYISNSFIHGEHIANDVLFYAKLIPLSNRALVTPGEIKTSVDLVIVYK